MKRLRISDWFYLLLASALVSRVIEDLLAGRWHIHAGEYFPWRHLPWFPLIPSWGLVVEWIGIVGCAIGFVRRDTRVWAARVAVIFLLLSLSQIFQNQKFLLLLVCLGASMEDPFNEKGKPVLWLLRWQLVFVYGFTAIHKLSEGFFDGQVIQGTAAYLLGNSEPNFFRKWILESLMGPDFARAASIATLMLEFAVPAFLTKQPCFGIACVIALHLGFSIVMPNLLCFSLTMIALSLLFLVPIRSGEPIVPSAGKTL